MVCSKNFFRILTKSVKIIYSRIFSKSLVVLRKECMLESGGKLLVLRTFIIHFNLYLVFIRVWPVEDLFEIRHLDKLHKLYDEFKYIHHTQSAQILQKHDGYNICNHWKLCALLVMWAQETHRAQVFVNYIYIYIYIYATQSAEISQKQDEYKAL